jgi:ketosteroid isomerase-like protein
MQAMSPDELPLVFRRHFNAGDIAGLMADYYAPAATYQPLPGEVVWGEGVQPSIAALVELGHEMELTVRQVLRSGDVALLIVDWVIPAVGFAGTATDVAQRQEDGSWKCVIDNPHGGAREVGDVAPPSSA